MKAILAISVCSLVVLLAACNKDKFETKPRLEIKDYSSKDVFQGQQLRIRMDYFDKEGDLSEALFYARLNRINVIPLPPAQDKSDSLDSYLPSFPPKDNGELSFTQDFSFLKESLTENDTIVFRFAVIDNAGHSSDTITSAPIVIHLP